MTDCAYKFSLGLVILILMYFDLEYVMWGVIGAVFLEGVTGWQLPIIVNKLTISNGGSVSEDVLGQDYPVRINFEAERFWRFIVAFLLLSTYVLYLDLFWFFPWFMGFAMVGAGISGVCPMILLLKWIGFR